MTDAKSPQKEIPRAVDDNKRAFLSLLSNRQKAILNQLRTMITDYKYRPLTNPEEIKKTFEEYKITSEFKYTAQLMNVDKFRRYLQVFSDDHCLLRFLCSFNWDVNKCLAQLVETVSWRISFGVDILNPMPMLPTLCSGALYLSKGRDRRGRPILVNLKSDREETSVGDDMRHLIFALESAVRLMPAMGEPDWIWVSDLGTLTRKNAPTVATCKGLAHILSNHYTERLRRAYVVNAPGAFTLFWACISPFVDACTKDRIKIFDDAKSAKALKSFSELIALDQLESRWGGKLPESEVSLANYTGREEDTKYNGRTASQYARENWSWGSAGLLAGPGEDVPTPAPASAPPPADATNGVTTDATNGVTTDATDGNSQKLRANSFFAC